jgi:hypothetical protein
LIVKLIIFAVNCRFQRGQRTEPDIQQPQTSPT